MGKKINGLDSFLWNIFSLTLRNLRDRIPAKQGKLRNGL